MRFKTESAFLKNLLAAIIFFTGLLLASSFSHAVTISGGEYFFGTDPGNGLGTPISLQNNTSNSALVSLDFQISTAALPQGSHTLFLRMKDSNGVWGPLRQHRLEVSHPNIISAAEYFFDSDPGPGAGTAIVPNDGLFNMPQESFDLTGLDISSLLAGDHILYLRMRDAYNRWGAAKAHPFTVGGPAAFTLAAPVQSITGDGRVPLSLTVSDQRPGATSSIRVEFSVDGGAVWQKTTLDPPSLNAGFGAPLLDNTLPAQITNVEVDPASGITGLNVDWLSAVDLAGREILTVDVRYTINNGTDPSSIFVTPFFQIDNIKPLVPALIPFLPKTSCDATPAFSWYPVSEAGQYHVQVSNSIDFGTLIVDIKTSDLFYTPSVNLTSGVVYWRVASVDAKGNESAFSVVDSFTLTADISPPAVSLEYGSEPAGIGPFMLKAVFSDPLEHAPLIAINQPGSLDIQNTPMTGSGTTWVYMYEVSRDNGAQYMDGEAIVTVSGGFDCGGNENIPPVNNRFLINTTGTPGTIIGAEYFIDRDPGEGAGVFIPAPDDGLYDSDTESVTGQIDTSGLKIGFHTVFVRFKNGDGTWGMAKPLSNRLHISSTPNLEVQGDLYITDAEYFIDIDPGPGRGTAVPAKDGLFDGTLEEVDLSLDTSSLSPGLHTLFLRMKDSNGEWGPLRQYGFEVFYDSGFSTLPDPVISYAEFFIDNDPGVLAATPVAAEDGLFDSPVETVSASIDTTLLSVGEHVLGIRFFDDSAPKRYQQIHRSFYVDEPDSDGDGINDRLETLYGLDPLNPADASLDFDGDGLTNLEEIRLGTNPLDPDSDRDGWFDGWEVNNGFDPLYDNTIPDGAVAYLTFDENGGAIAADSTQYGNDGAVNGALWGSGISGSSLQFSGGATVNMGNDASLGIIGDQTIEMWINPGPLVGRQNPLNKAYGGEGTITLEPNGTVNYFFGTCGGDCPPPSYTMVTMTQPLVPNEWAHLMVVRDLSNGFLRWYKNGALTDEIATTYTTASVSANPLQLGSGYAGNFNGSIDELGIYSRALTAQEAERRFLRYAAGILNVIANDGSGTGAGLQAGDQVIILFNGETNAPVIDETNIDSALGLGMYSWLDGAGQIGNAVWSSTNYPNDTLTVTLSGGVSLPVINPGNQIMLDGLTVRNKFGDPILGSAVLEGSFDFNVPQGAIVYLTFDENTGTQAFDTSGGGHTGDIFGATWTNGVSGSALDFDGVQDYVEFGDVFNDIQLPVTISTWVLNRTANTNIFFCSDMATSYSGSYAGFHISNQGLGYGDATGNGPGDRRTLGPVSSLPVNKWVHVTGVINGPTDMAYYVNGKRVATTYSGSGGAMVHNTFTARIGNHEVWGPYFFDGLIDNFAIYARTLTDIEIQQLFLLGIKDSDGDGMYDSWEKANGLDPLNSLDAGFDNDSDGLTNLEEYHLGTDPNNPDTDGDGMPDWWEVASGLDPRTNDATLDPDADGLTNFQEYEYYTNPILADTDGDGVNDGNEVTNGSNPRELSSYLGAGAGDVFLPFGSSKTIIVSLSNKNTVVDSFDLSISGIPVEFFTLSQTHFILSAGETRDIPVEIHIPDNCAIFPLDYTVHITAASPVTGQVVNGGADIGLHLLTDPLISDVFPVNGEKLPINTATFAWATDKTSTTELFYKVAGDSVFMRTEGIAGTNHEVTLNNLVWDAEYLWYARSTGSCGVTQSGVRSFRVEDGVVFTGVATNYTIERDYDQKVSVSILNRDTVKHQVLLKLFNPHNDFIAGFTGSGSVDDALTLEPGETTIVTLALHAQDAKKDIYPLLLRLETDPGSLNPIVDTANIHVMVNKPAFNLVWSQVTDPALLTNTYTITNMEKTLTDLDVFTDEAVAPYILFEPRIHHMRVPAGTSVTFSATFKPGPGQSDQLSTQLYATAAGQGPSIEPTHFGCPTGTSLFDVVLSNVSVCQNISSWYCTNRPDISVDVIIPPGIQSQDITRARFYTNFTLKSPRQFYRKHNVVESFNLRPVATWLNTIPQGAFGADIPATLIQTGDISVGHNLVSLNTEHMNKGHYAVASNFQMILDLNTLNTGKVCAASQTEADQRALNLPYLCDGIPAWDLCPRRGDILAKDISANVKTDFFPGETVELLVDIENPDIDPKIVTVEISVDKDFSGNTVPYQHTFTNISLPANGKQPISLSFTIPAATNVSSYQVKVLITDGAACSSSEIINDVIAVVQPLTGVVRENETGATLAGATICALDFLTKAPTTLCVTSALDGTFSMSLPHGSYTLIGGKAGFTPYYRSLSFNAVTPTLAIDLSNLSASLGSFLLGGHTLDPVTTATGNFTFEETDLSFKGRGLKFSFTRFYNSQNAYSGPLGYGWTHNFNTHIQFDGSTAIIKHGDGSGEFFVKQPDGSFQGQPGSRKTLTQNLDGSFTLNDKKKTVFSFSALGALNSITDKNGNSLTLTYLNGLLSSVVDPVGRTVTFAYDADNRIIGLTDPLGRSIQYAYGVRGDLVSYINPLGHEEKYAYDNLHQMVKATDPKGAVLVANTYDAKKRTVSTQGDALGNLSYFYYDDLDHVTTIVDPLGNKTIHQHDNRNRLIKVIDPKRATTTIDYDADNNRVRVTDKRGNATNYAYDTSRNLIQVTDVLNASTTFTYDVSDNLIKKTDSLGAQTLFEYDVKGNLIKVTDPLLNETLFQLNIYGQPVQSTDSRTHSTNFTYDVEGNLIEIQDALGFLQRFTYDAVGQMLSATDQLGRTRTLIYDAMGRVVEDRDPAPFNFSAFVEYDPNGNQTATTDRRGSRTTYGYDPKDRLVEIKNPLSEVIRFTYDAVDRKLSSSDPLGRTTFFKYDEAGNQTEITNALGHKKRVAYDNNGNITALTDQLGQKISFTYDALNRLVFVVDPLGNRTSFTYSSLGKILSKTDGKGRITRYEYDALQRLSKVTEPGGGITSYSYDGAGNKIGFTNSSGNLLTYEYDVLNRLIRDADGNSFTYDGAGNLVSSTDATGQQITYEYDEKNRLVKRVYPDATFVSYGYDAIGNQILMTDSLGTSETSFDNLNRPIQTIDPFGNTLKFQYDRVGNLTLLTYPDNKAVAYQYDQVNQLQSVTDWYSRVTTYAYDPKGKLLSTDNPNGSNTLVSYDKGDNILSLTNRNFADEVLSRYTFTLDAIGNRIQTEKKEPLIPFIQTRTATYSYDANNRIAVSSEGTVLFDANGNMTQKDVNGKSLSYLWNFDNRLKTRTQGTEVVTYLYDGNQIRRGVVRNGVEKRFVVNTITGLPSVLAETDTTGNITARYIYGLGLIAREDEQGTHYYHYDPLGSTIALTNGQGNTTDNYVYDTFGSLANRAGKTENPFTYVGKFGLMDEGDGLYFARARYYDSGLGRFLNKDLLLGADSDPASLHRYAYVLNLPTGLVDVSGLRAVNSVGFTQVIENVLNGFTGMYGFVKIIDPLNPIDEGLCISKCSVGLSFETKPSVETAFFVLEGVIFATKGAVVVKDMYTGTATSEQAWNVVKEAPLLFGFVAGSGEWLSKLMLSSFSSKVEAPTLNETVDVLRKAPIVPIVIDFAKMEIAGYKSFMETKAAKYLKSLFQK